MNTRHLAPLGRIAFILSILGLGSFAFALLSVEPEEEKAKSGEKRRIRTKVTTLSRDDYTVIIKTNGIIQPHNQITISSETAGRVVAIHPGFEVGAFFCEGDVLMELDPSQIEDKLTQQQINYEQAFADKIIAESNVEVAKTSITEYLEGTFPEQRGNLEREIFDADEAVRAAELAFASATRLAAKGAIRALQLEAEEIALQSVRKARELKHQRLAVLEKYTKKKVLLELEAVLRAAEVRLTASKAALELENQRLQRDQVIAPFDGRVHQNFVGLGQQVDPGTALGEVFSVDYAEVRLPLAQSELQYLDLPEMSGDATVDVQLRDALHDAAGHTWTGKIVRTEGQLDPDSLELFAVARIDDPFGLRSRQPVLRIGHPVVATIAGKTLRNVIKIPRHAVRQLDKVMLVDNENLTLSQKTIEPLWSDEDFVVVREPSIQDGDLLATTNLVYAPQGSRVEIIPDAESDTSLAASELGAP